MITKILSQKKDEKKLARFYTEKQRCLNNKKPKEEKPRDILKISYYNYNKKNYELNICIEAKN